MPGYGDSPFSASAMGTPNRGTSEYQLDQWNRAMRSSDIYLNFMRRNALPTDGRVRLSRDQQAALERELRSAGFNIPGGMHIDQGGNLNQKNRLVRNSLIAAGVAGGGLAGLGAAGIGPFSGLAGAGGGAGAAGAATLPGELPWAFTPYAGTAGMSAPGAAAATGGTLGTGSGLFGGSQSVAFGSELPATGFPISPYAGSVASSPTGAAAVGGTVGTGSGWTAGGAGTGAAGGVSGAGAGKILNNMTTRDLLAIASVIPGAISPFTSGNGDINPGTGTDDPNLQQLIAAMQRRLDKSEPLYDSALSMANGLLPTRYQRNG